MGLIDTLVSNAFRDGKAGRIVVFSGDRRNRGYLVSSASDEQKIRAFLKMFYFAHLAIILLGLPLANSWSMFIINIQSMGQPAGHLLRSEAIFAGIYCVVFALPYFFLWRSYKRSFLTFVLPKDEVSVSGSSPAQRNWILTVILISLVLFILLTGVLLLLIRHR